MKPRYLLLTLLFLQMDVFAHEGEEGGSTTSTTVMILIVILMATLITASFYITRDKKQ